MMKDGGLREISSIDPVYRGANALRMFLGLPQLQFSVHGEPVLPTPMQELDQPSVHFDPAYFQKCEDLLRGNCVEDPDNISGRHQHEQVVHAT